MQKYRLVTLDKTLDINGMSETASLKEIHFLLHQSITT